MHQTQSNAYILLLFLFGMYFSSNCQDSLIKPKKIKILPVPAFGYSPETRTYIGAVALFTIDLYQDSITRSSNAKIEFNYTWNKQSILEGEWHYFFKEEKWYTHGLLHYSDYPDLYYGIGANTPETNELTFESTRIKTEINLLKKIRNKLFLGFGLRYFNYSKIHFFEKPNPYSELQNSSNFGIKLIALHDSRNNILTPTAGTFIEIKNTFNFSKNNYDQIAFDFRKYYKPFKKYTHVFAGRAYHSSVLGTPAFYDQSLIGSDKFVRGYFYGRFRDKNLTTIQLEYRMKLFWRFGLATFGGVSMIYPNLKNLDNNMVKPNLGAGLRFLVDKKENTFLRFDYAIGTGKQSGFYVSFGESF